MNINPGARRSAAISLLTVLLLITCRSMVHAETGEDAENIHNIAVLAFRGKDKAIRKWGAVADYLGEQIPGHKFVIKTFDLDGMDEVVSNGDVDFVLTNPGNYVRLETLFGITRLATLSNLYNDKSYTVYAAVIFSRADDQSIRILQDLRGRSFMAVSKRAFGGFQMAWYELDKLGIDPFSDFSSLQFNGFPQDRIVMAVLAGEVDAGTVRAETLQRMIDEGKVRHEDIHVINLQYANEYPFRHSTRLYPEWAFAKLKYTDEKLAQRVAVALLTQQSGSITSRRSKINGWTIPLDYSRVHATFRHLKIPPYNITGEVNLSSVWDKYGPWIILVIILLAMLAAATVHVGRINRRLSISRQELQKEIDERKQVQQQLARHSDLLEETVNQRTLELQAVNLELEQDIQARKTVEEQLRSSELALRRLYEITSSTELDYEDKIASLLKFGLGHFHVNAAQYLVNTPEGFVLEQSFPDSATGATYSPSIDDFCYGRSINVHDRPAAAICFICNTPDKLSLSLVDEDILQLMGQWIGGETERKISEEKALQHQNDLAHVSRLGMMGEMASGLAHELNQPLTAIANYTRGCIRRLQGNQPDIPPIISAIEHTASEAERAAKIIKRLRDFVSKGEMSRNITDIGDIINMCIDIMRSDFDKNNITLKLEMADDLPPVYVDHIQIEQVILNLLRNSVESLSGTVGRRTVAVSVTEENGVLVILVHDNGPGVPVNMRDHLFHPFFTTKKQGMGLGLSISTSILEAHGGQLELLDNGNKPGCRFRFEIPVAANDMISAHA